MKKAPPKPIPYVSFHTLISTLDHLKTSSLNMSLDQVQCGSLSNSTWSQMISSLRFFDLINEKNIPKEELRKLVHAVDRKPLLRKLLKTHYPGLFPRKSSPLSLARVNRLLAGYSISGATVGRARSFLLGAAKYSEISLSNDVLRLIRHRTARKPRSATKIRHQNSRSNHVKTDANQTEAVVLKVMDVELSFPISFFDELEKDEREHIHRVFDELIVLRRRAAARAASQKEPLADDDALSQEPSDEAVH